MTVFWLEQRDPDVPDRDEWLGPVERARMQRFLFAKRRADWRLGRWTAKNAVALHLGLEDLPRIEIIASESGAPEVFLDGEAAPVAISLSHSSGVAACAVCPAGVSLGCDIEKIEPRGDLFYADYFTSAEQMMLRNDTSGDRARLATILWSAKESTLKALREGLRMDTRSVAVVCVAPARGEEQWSHLAVRTEAKEMFEGWWREAGGLVRAMVASSPAAPPVPLRAAECGAAR